MWTYAFMLSVAYVGQVGGLLATSYLPQIHVHVVENALLYVPTYTYMLLFQCLINNVTAVSGTTAHSTLNSQSLAT